MATSSIFNCISVKDEASCRLLLDAMEAAENAAKDRVRKPVRVTELKTKEAAAEFFKK